MYIVVSLGIEQLEVCMFGVCFLTFIGLQPAQQAYFNKPTAREIAASLESDKCFWFKPRERGQHYMEEATEDIIFSRYRTVTQSINY